jgi:hypothetical protein
MGTRLTELIQEADGLDLARAKTPFGWFKMPLGAFLTHVTTHNRRHLWQAEQVRNDPNFPIVERVANPNVTGFQVGGTP